MNILITGHSGFLGDHTAKYFKKMGHKVYGVSRSLRENCQYPQYSILRIKSLTINKLKIIYNT